MESNLFIGMGTLSFHLPDQAHACCCRFNFMNLVDELFVASMGKPYYTPSLTNRLVAGGQGTEA